MKMRRIQHLLTEQQVTALNQLAEDTGLKRSEHIRRAIDAYLEALKRINARQD